MNHELLNPEFQQFVAQNYKEDFSKIILKGSAFPGVSTQELAQQLKGKSIAEKKLPSWFFNNNVIYPPTLNLEQTSSEITAKYKASLVSGECLADLTGGFGVDSFFFSEKVKKVISVEQNKGLSQIAAHNFEALNATNINAINADSLQFLKQHEDYFDWIYIDPSRRDDSGGRVFFLSDCIPNVPENLGFLFQKAENMLLKTSPLLDISAALSVLGNVSEIHIVAVKNEVKELLFKIEKSISSAPKIKTINFRSSKNEVFETTFEENASAILNFHLPQQFLYEPNAAIMKSGMFRALGASFGLKKLHENSHLFTSEEKKTNFPGRIFQIEQIVDFQKKLLKKFLNFQKAHITARNFPLSVADLRKQLKLKDGGENYLFFTTTVSDKKIVLICRKIK